jgi:hypothetical protein
MQKCLSVAIELSNMSVTGDEKEDGTNVLMNHARNMGE